MWSLTNIPKIAHFYWGNETLPFMRYVSVLSFAKLNPDWTIQFHVPETYGKLNSTWNTPEHKAVSLEDAQDYSEKLAEIPNIRFVKWKSEDLGGQDISEVFKSDFLRWKLLSYYGGLWSDMDIIYFRPMSELYLNKHRDASYIETVYCYPKGVAGFDNHSIGFLMSSKGNRHFTKINSMAPEAFDKDRYQSIGMNLLMDYSDRTGDLIRSNMFDHNLAPQVVYPFNWVTVKNIYDEKYAHVDVLKSLPEQTLGIHWYGGDAMTGQVCKAMTSKNYREFPSIFTSIVSKTLGDTDV